MKKTLLVFIVALGFQLLTPVSKFTCEIERDGVWRCKIHPTAKE